MYADCGREVELWTINKVVDGTPYLWTGPSRGIVWGLPVDTPEVDTVAAGGGPGQGLDGASGLRKWVKQGGDQRQKEEEGESSISQKGGDGQSPPVVPKTLPSCNRKVEGLALEGVGLHPSLVYKLSRWQVGHQGGYQGESETPSSHLK